MAVISIDLEVVFACSEGNSVSQLCHYLSPYCRFSVFICIHTGLQEIKTETHTSLGLFLKYIHTTGSATITAFSKPI